MRGNVPGIGINFEAADTCSKFEEGKINPDGSPVPGSRILYMYEDDGLWGRCTVDRYMKDENSNEWAVQLFFDNGFGHSFVWKNVTYLYLQDGNKESSRYLYNDAVNLNLHSQIAKNCELGKIYVVFISICYTLVFSKLPFFLTQ